MNEVAVFCFRTSLYEAADWQYPPQMPLVFDDKALQRGLDTHGKLTWGRACPNTADDALGVCFQVPRGQQEEGEVGGQSDGEPEVGVSGAI